VTNISDYTIYERLGGRLREEGASFGVWAPNAREVFVLGDFNGWEPVPLELDRERGVWERSLAGCKGGDRYQFEVVDAEGNRQRKSDPYGFFFEHRPNNASILYDIESFTWTDGEWMGARKKRPLNIYEVHLGSWKQGLGYRQLGIELAAYCKKMGFTHVEFLPVTEHPLDESWGYQTTGYYAPTSRYGTPHDFQAMVDHLHGQGIGVILDWVPGHFPTDEWALARFDGTALYAHLDPRKGLHPHWDTYMFNYGRWEVSNFLIANALFWCEKYHIDGLRTDAVASMLYLDFGREPGEWLPNKFGGRENLEAIAFLKHLNRVIDERHPDVLMIAEESSTYAGVTHEEGLGFDYKWNMGWMNDTLSFFKLAYDERPANLEKLTFGMMYFYSERFLLTLSHDEVVHLKRSLLLKSPEDPFANLRLLYSYMLCKPGGKLLFMGGELGQPTEWSEKGEVPWQLLEKEEHRALHEMVRALNHLYLATPALWELDHDPEGFAWIDCEDKENCILSYRRKGVASEVICVHNFLPKHHKEYPLEQGGLIFSTAGEIARTETTIEVPPLSTLILAAP
jgi:1,4-alpha-glucan branching enzyme